MAFIFSGIETPTLNTLQQDFHYAYKYLKLFYFVLQDLFFHYWIVPFLLLDKCSSNFEGGKEVFAFVLFLCAVVQKDILNCVGVQFLFISLQSSEKKVTILLCYYLKKLPLLWQFSKLLS